MEQEYIIIPNLSYLGNKVYYKPSDEKEPVAIVEATSVNNNISPVTAYAVSEPINSSSSSSISSYRRRDSETPGYIKYSDGNHLKEVPRPAYINPKDIRFSFFQENPKKTIYQLLGRNSGFVPIGHFVGAQKVRGEYEYKFSVDDTGVYDDYSILYYDPTSSGGNKRRKSYRRNFSSIKKKSRKLKK
jgi:hypothetical protein